MQLGILFLSATASGCGAFEDAASSPNTGPGLTIEPFYIQQGGIGEFTISYTKPPPWADEIEGHAYVISLDLGSDIQAQSYSYNGVDKVQAVLVASNSAAPGDRRIYLTCGFEKFGHKQQKFSAWGNFYVYSPTGQADSQDGGVQ